MFKKLNFSAEIIVVGSGPGGATVARELSKQGKNFDCQATCMLGCRCGTKWNAAKWVDEAVSNGT